MCTRWQDIVQKKLCFLLFFVCFHPAFLPFLDIKLSDGFSLLSPSLPSPHSLSSFLPDFLFQPLCAKLLERRWKEKEKPSLSSLLLKTSWKRSIDFLLPSSDEAKIFSKRWCKGACWRVGGWKQHATTHSSINPLSFPLPPPFSPLLVFAQGRIGRWMEEERGRANV